ncbi:MAG: AraC family transcriptional regulator [Bacteroidota bacterium]
MQYRYQDQKTGAYLGLTQSERGFHREYFKEKDKPYLTIAWNRGPAQKVTVDEIAYEVGEGEIVLLAINQTFHFSRAGDIIAWQFNRDFYCIIDHDQEVSCVGFIFYGLPSPMVVHLDKKELHSFDLLHQVFVEEFGNHDNIQAEMLRMLLKRLIIKLTRIAKQQHLREQLVQPELDIVRKYNLLVEKHYKDYHQVQDYANLLHKSPKTLSNLFKKAGAKSPLKIIQERVALEGKRLLLYTDKDVAEVAYETGFHEASHFSRFFKKMTGMPPGAFRARTQDAR